MPAGIPVGTLAIGDAGAKNAGILAAQILSAFDSDLSKKVSDYRKEQSDFVINNPDPTK